MGLRAKSEKLSKNGNSYSGRVKGAAKQKKTSRSGGWFTEKDAKSVTKAVIGRFYNT